MGAVSTVTTAPTISSLSPNDNSTYNSPATTVAATFSKKMATGSVTTNTNDTSCSGSYQLSSDNFTTCIKMSATPSASDNDTAFTATPADNLSNGTTFKLRITTSAKDTSSNSLVTAYTTNGFTTSPSGSGTIRGTVRYDNNTAAENVSISFAKSGTTVGNTTTANNGTYSQDNLSLGVYNIAFTKSDYLTTSQSATLATDNQTITANVTLLADSCSAGTISGTISDAVSGSAKTDVSLSVRSGLSVTSGSTTGTTATSAANGTYTLSSMSAGGYTVQVSINGYLTSYFNVNVCGNMSNQNIGISEELSSGTMRIVLSWPSGSTADDLDSHLEIPDNASSTFHVYWPSSNDTFYYAKNANTCSSCSSDQLSDNVTLDLDDDDGAPGTETITITKVRSGTYSYSVLDYDNAGNASSTVLSTSGASVKVYYNNTTTTFNVPNSAGDLWRVFTFTTSGGLIPSGNMSSASNSASVY